MLLLWLVYFSLVYCRVSVCLAAVMAELDLSLSDALTDSVPQPDPETLVERDFVAELEAEPFEDQVGEIVGKTDYIPLLDNDDTRAGENDDDRACIVKILTVLTSEDTGQCWTVLGDVGSVLSRWQRTDRKGITAVLLPLLQELGSR